ncbi:XTP/dITP diphosphatase [Candidatus Nomurabacteria bacterium]|nr:XTP/dITP diphosphatase [Candidatus Nomurabacteria bacterium]
MKKLLIATRSKGKFPEIVKKLEGLDFELLNLNDLEDLPKDFEVEEPGMTFEGNALIKAITLATKTGLLTLADDSGLEIDALDGRPGVYSARYAEGSDADRYNKILEEMKGVQVENRTARFKTVIAICDPETMKIRTCEGSMEGRITEEPKGENGFGYDPIFFVNEKGKNSAELTLEEKNEVSHRGNALEKAREILVTSFQI